MVSKKSKKKKKKKKNCYCSPLEKTDMVLGKKVAIFDWEWGRNSTHREGQKITCNIWSVLPEPSFHAYTKYGNNGSDQNLDL